jgi:serine/threonine protein kinase
VEPLPKTIGEYENVRPIGSGGMGNVFLARHTKLGRQVALKVLASHRLADSRMLERFEAEMRAVGRLSHPNIVTAHDAREVDGTAVLVTELVSGLDLD